MPTKIEKDAVSGRETTGHSWDGLTELNTPLPKWWLYVFYCCIAFAAVWVVLFPALPVKGATGLLGWTARGAFPAELARAREAQEPYLVRLRAATPEAIAADPSLRGFALAGGRAAFAANCTGCHGAGGQGAKGGFPSLADDDWIWGGSLDAIHHTIAHGVRNQDSPDARATMMPRFQADGLLKANEVDDTAEYVLSLSGRETNAEAAKRGAEHYETNCVSCHSEKGAGNQELGAPNLADSLWLYGGDKASIVYSIANARAGVMPAWGLRLDPATVNMLAVYVHSLGGGDN